jgi:hypothetical protein
MLIKPSLRNYTRSFALIAVALYVLSATVKTTEWHFIDGVNLIFHEAGHTIAFFLPQTLSILAGSFLQVAVPLLCALYFFLRKDIFSGSIILLWAGQSVVNVSVYVADALAQELPLLGGDAVIHDWNYLLSQYGMLSSASLFGQVLYGLGVLIIFVAIALGLFRVSYGDNTTEGGDCKSAD